ncbi:UNVERIFIED_CONTAM: beta-lactamase regulating signal transducer with metallopeptidase domain [Acetivibrio alkalicellulosi]
MFFLNIFNSVINMSITAAIVATVIILIRLMLKDKFPKIFCYSIWIIVLIRILVPVSISFAFSIFSIIPASLSTPATQTSNAISSITYISYNTENFQNPEFTNINENYHNLTPESNLISHNNSTHIMMLIASVIWFLGFVIFLTYCIVTYFKIYNRLKTSVIYKNEVLISKCSKKLKIKKKIRLFTSDRINTPLVCGIITPRIILPLKLTKNCDTKTIEHVILHELVHIKRIDYVLKPLWLLALCIHWFNPVIWICYILFQKDMEISCDEKVISVSEKDIRVEYASSILNLAVKQDILMNGGLLAFGESNIKSRIKVIGKYKKSGFLVGVGTVVALILLVVFLLTNNDIYSDEAEKVTKNDSITNQEFVPTYDDVIASNEESIATDDNFKKSEAIDKDTEVWSEYELNEKESLNRLLSIFSSWYLIGDDLISYDDSKPELTNDSRICFALFYGLYEDLTKNQETWESYQKGTHNYFKISDTYKNGVRISKDYVESINEEYLQLGIQHRTVNVSEGFDIIYNGGYYDMPLGNPHGLRIAQILNIKNVGDEFIEVTGELYLLHSGDSSYFYREKSKWPNVDEIEKLGYFSAKLKKVVQDGNIRYVILEYNESL